MVAAIQSTPALPVQQMGFGPSAQAKRQALSQPETPAAAPDRLMLPGQAVQTGQVPAQDLHFFFFSDNHSRPELLQKLAGIANQEDPDLVLDGGDFVHDGTEPEIQRAFALRQGFESPLYMVSGNHDAKLRGPFSAPPPQIPAFQSFDAKGAHFILLDDENETLSEAQFQQLEADLKAHSGQATFVAMHVPPKLSKEPLTVKLGKHLPLNFASPLMHDPEQVKRFHALMKQYGVKAVLTGHTHFPDEVVEDGVRYITAGSSGGLNPKPGLAKEFLDIRLHGDQLSVVHRPLAAASSVVSYAPQAFEFYADLNRFNHDKLGWNYFPSGNVSWQGGIRQVTTSRGESLAPTAGAGFERISPSGRGAAFGSVSVSAGTQDLGAQVALGYKHALLGDYNRGLYVSGAATGNAGYLQGQGTAGVGVRAGIGAQYHHFTLEIGQEWASNYKAQTLTAGYRF